MFKGSLSRRNNNVDVGNLCRVIWITASPDKLSHSRDWTAEMMRQPRGVAERNRVCDDGGPRRRRVPRALLRPASAVPPFAPHEQRDSDSPYLTLKHNRHRKGQIKTVGKRRSSHLFCSTLRRERRDSGARHLDHQNGRQDWWHAYITTRR